MGLDMGLYRREAPDEVMYWRKANAIREWFANNLADFHDNGETRVYKEDLESLLETVRTVLANRDKAPGLLPTSSGFFFGSLEYDDYYWEWMEETEEKLEEIIQETDWDHQEIYYWEWY